MELIATALIETGEIHVEKAKIIQLKDYRDRRVGQVKPELLFVAHASELHFSLPPVQKFIK